MPDSASEDASAPSAIAHTLAGDPPAREHAIEHVIEHAIEQTIEHAGGPRSEPAARLARGTMIRRYVVLDEIGAGGMGVFYAAYDYGLDRRIALKLVRDRGGATVRARLMREAQALAKLSHPDVVAIYDVGEHDGDVYVAMELVDARGLLADSRAAGRSRVQLHRWLRRFGLTATGFRRRARCDPKSPGDASHRARCAIMPHRASTARRRSHRYWRA